jgi:hypothetical protein
LKPEVTNETDWTDAERMWWLHEANTWLKALINTPPPPAGDPSTRKTETEKEEGRHA